VILKLRECSALAILKMMFVRFCHFLILFSGGKEEPPALMLKNYGKLITIHPQKIAVNALIDGDEAEKIVAWLQREINETWEKRLEIKPCTESEKRPILFEVFKLLPRTNCQECGETTCMVFANRVIEGSMRQDDCSMIASESREKLKDYLSQFQFE